MPQDYASGFWTGQGGGKERDGGPKMFSGINRFKLSLKDEEELPLMEESRGDRTL